MSQLPDGWKNTKFPDAVWFQEGPGLRKWQFTTEGIKVINVTNLVDGNLDLTKTDRHLSWLEFQERYQHFAIDADDIVMASSGNSYGKIAVVREQNLPLVMNTSVIRFKPRKGIEYGFLKHFLTSTGFRQQIDLLITGGAQPNFGPVHLRQIVIPLPPLAEQRKIAEILSTWDEAIQLVESLIAALKARKRGLMQRLLTGAVRFPGFDGEWERKKAGEIFKPFSKRKNSGEELLSVTQDQGVIPRSMLDTRVVMPDGSTDSYKLVEPGDFIISLRSFQGGLEYSEYRGLVSPAYTVLKHQLPISDNFYKYFSNLRNLLTD